MRLLPLTVLIVFSLVDAAAYWRLIPAQTVSEWVWSPAEARRVRFARARAEYRYSIRR